MMGAPTTTPVPVMSWPDLATLRAQAARATDPWLLVERTGPDSVAVGPVFAPDLACFECYVRRRTANGGRACLPVGRLTTAQADVLDRTAARLPVGGQHVLAADGRVVGTHRLLPAPACGCHTPAPPDLHLDDAVSDRLGIVHRLDEWVSTWTGMSMCVSIAAGTGPTLGQEARCHGVAADRTAERSRLRAVGETLERYAAAQDPAWPDDLVPVTDLAGSPAGSASAGRVYLPHRAVPDGTTQTSTGLAAGPTWAAATRHAVGEAVERHAFMSAWESGMGFARVDVSGPAPSGLRVARVLTDQSVVIAVAGFEHPEPPLAAIGLGSGWSWRDAEQGAVLEACAALEMLHRADSQLAAIGYPPMSLEDHAAVHALRPELRTARQRLWEGPTYHATAPEPTWADVVRTRQQDRVAEVTTPDVAALGVRVVRAVCSGLRDLASDGARELASGAPPHPIG